MGIIKGLRRLLHVPNTLRELTQSLPRIGDSPTNSNNRETAKMMISETPPGLPPAPQEAERLKSAAEQLEASFLAQMLKSAGVGETPEGFGGGIGEDQFASFLRREQAREMAAAGGIGLAQSLFEAMMAGRDD
jgi:hypothetical protein